MCIHIGAPAADDGVLPLLRPDLFFSQVGSRRSATCQAAPNVSLYVYIYLFIYLFIYTFIHTYLHTY